ncbi:hypothetical protein NVS47_15875 [Dehalobacterium formicoaceticum]|uniref:Uncharacterized protein n=1 Tax=Dehalobacterium formicoaceticum TaxID=51515 RepID=A0ABT1YA41_9FIRM|nr:hypothetical protein [Dehalobacterium formicoaceticum]MCR6546970.1 hypothetical protein [Dehalobacterium formicoaceticum]
MQRLVVTDYRIAANVSKQLTIAIVADLHDRSWEAMRESLDSRKPDIIAVPGDRWIPRLGNPPELVYVIIG